MNTNNDDERQMHVKNLLTTLNSWSAHMDQCGNDKETCNSEGVEDSDPYRYCGSSHNMLATEMRVINSNLHRAYEADYIDSGAAGGGIHRDYFGPEYGKKKEAY